VILNCSRLKEGVAARFGEQVRVLEQRDQCIVTLPLRTIDDDRISVVVEEKLGYFLVHDGGKTDSALFSQGVSLRPKKLEEQQEIAKRFGVEVVGSLIRRAGPLRDLQQVYDAIFAVAQCAALASLQVLAHQIEIEDDPITARVGRAVERWRPNFVNLVERNKKVEGALAQHTFNFVAHAADPKHRTTAVRVLPSTKPHWQAERYGFLSLDIKDHRVFGKWKKLAVIHRPEEWHPNDLALVERLSDQTVFVKKEAENEIDSAIPAALNLLTAERIA
jgi:hypothetical protein